MLLVIGVSVALTLYLNRQKGPKFEYKPGVVPQWDQAVRQAKKVYEDKKALGIDFSSGPCLTNDLMPDYVLDLVHNPRQAVDDLPQNQCQAYIEGRARHFVEMDLDGNIAQIQ